VVDLTFLSFPWHPRSGRRLHLRSYARPKTKALEHAAIVAALMQRDPEGARQAMHTHLMTVQKNLLGR
jgi:DNA-binding FadR family transcriptional regulator